MRRIVQDREAWRCMVMEVACDKNKHKEAHKKEMNERKKRREEGTQPATLDWKCEESGCDFSGKTKAGIVNYTRQRHGYGGS